MNKLVLALTLLAAGASAFHSARHYASQLQQQVEAANESWQTHTQQLAAAQSEQAALSERVRELKQTLAQIQPAAENALWSALQTNRADRLPPELRERLLEELGLNWRSSPDFIVVSKQALRDINMVATRDNKLTDVATAVLGLTPDERDRIDAAVQRIQGDFKDWVLTHVERAEPKDDVAAQYTLPKDPTMSQSITNNFLNALSSAVGRERPEFVVTSSPIYNWMFNFGLHECDVRPATMIVTRYLVGKEQRLKFRVDSSYRGNQSGDVRSDLDFWQFPATFRPLFPNGWADVAKREGFELPPPPEKK